MTTNDSFDPQSQVKRKTTKAVTAAKDRIDAVGATADRALDAASSNLDNARDDAIPALKQGVDEAKSWIEDTTGRLQDGFQSARDKASDVTDQVIDYTRDEPVKALLIAAAVGAGLMVLISAMTRSRN